MFRARQLPEGTQVALSGKIERKKGRLEMKSPEADVLDRPGESLVTGRVVPVHPGVKGVGPGYLRRGIHNAVQRSLPVTDPIPAEMRERLSLMDRSAAIETIHFPESLEEVVPARDRLVFDELFRLEVALALQKRQADRRGSRYRPCAGGRRAHGRTGQGPPVSPHRRPAASDR